MSKAGDMLDARMQGMEYALRQVEKIGVEEFRKEMKWRCANGVKFTLTPQEIKEVELKANKEIYRNVRCMAMMILYDEFDFDREKLLQFNNRFNLKEECMIEDRISFDEYVKELESILGEKVEDAWK